MSKCIICEGIPIVYEAGRTYPVCKRHMNVDFKDKCTWTTDIDDGFSTSCGHSGKDNIFKACSRCGKEIEKVITGIE